MRQTPHKTSSALWVTLLETSVALSLGRGGTRIRSRGANLDTRLSQSLPVETLGKYDDRYEVNKTRDGTKWLMIEWREATRTWKQPDQPSKSGMQSEGPILTRSCSCLICDPAKPFAAPRLLFPAGLAPDY